MSVKNVLIATLGAQPQVVTFALDALLARNERVDETIVLHVTQSGSQQALRKLQQEFSNEHYAGHRCSLRAHALYNGSQRIEDIQDESAAEAVLQQVRTLIAQLKQQNCRLHLCVTGGRRLISFMVLAAAALLCDHHDRIWHMYTPDPLRQAAEGGRLMHVPPDSAIQLIQVPLVPWGTWFPGLRAMAQTPQEAVSVQMEWLRSGDDERCQQVYSRLTERERATLAAFARGLTPQQVAEALTIGISTVNTYKTKILDECRNAWGQHDGARLDYHFIAKHFEPFLRRRG
ncbi:MAG: CRISPR-associated ring nuclease [Caldilineaceae bacterium]